MPIIKSLLDTDLYKFTMQQAMLHRFPANDALYKFRCRNNTDFPLAELDREVRDELDALCELKYSEEELEYLASLRFIKRDYVDFLRIFSLNRKSISVGATKDGSLDIRATGSQIYVMPFETFVSQIVNELYFSKFNQYEIELEAAKRLDAKIEKLKGFDQGFEFFDFGSRRRMSRRWHETVVKRLSTASPLFKGTSNVDLARRLNLTPIGTMAHEWLQTFQAVDNVPLGRSQREALEGWVQEYRGDLGIALTDVIGMDAFLNDFDLYFAKLFDGLRHDSGDPFEWGEKAIAHYEKLGIDPKTKRLVFSDGLDLDLANRLYMSFKDRAMLGFGIGTNLTNDTPKKALNIVMKLVECNGKPVAKISDVPGKTMCENEVFLNYLKQVYNVTPRPSSRMKI